MKKIISVSLLILLIVYLPACEKADLLGKEFTAADIQGKLIGKWYFNSLDTAMVSVPLTECQKQSYLEFPQSTVTSNADYKFYDGCTSKTTDGKYSLTLYGTIITLENKSYSLVMNEGELIMARVVSGSNLTTKGETKVYIKK